MHEFLPRFCGDSAAVLSIQVPDKEGDVSGIALQGVHAVQAPDETKGRITLSKATEGELSANVSLLEHHERGLDNENRRSKHQLVDSNVDKNVARIVGLLTTSLLLMRR